jgi:hypothetical protein
MYPATVSEKRCLSRGVNISSISIGSSSSSIMGTKRGEVLQCLQDLIVCFLKHGNQANGTQASGIVIPMEQRETGEYN